VTPSLLTFSRHGTVGVARLDLLELVHPDELAQVSHEFREWASGTGSDCAAYVLDLTRLTYMTSGAIGMLINMHAHLKAGQKQFVVAANDTLIGEIVRHTHLDEVFSVYKSVDEAVTNLS
jgi:anti-anti-sigma factor